LTHNHELDNPLYYDSVKKEMRNPETASSKATLWVTQWANQFVNWLNWHVGDYISPTLWRSHLSCYTILAHIPMINATSVLNIVDWKRKQKLQWVIFITATRFLFYGHFWAHTRLNGPNELQIVMRQSEGWNIHLI